MKQTYFLLFALIITAIGHAQPYMLDATVTVNASNKLVVTINSPASFEFNQTLNAPTGFSLIIAGLYAEDPPTLTTTVESGVISYTAPNGNSGNAAQMGPFGFDFELYDIRDGEVTFTQQPATPFLSGDIINISAGTIISSASFNPGQVPAINPGPYTAFIMSDDYKSVAAPQVETQLPVEINTFSGVQRAKDILLKWNTASESGNEGFVIQHSKDGIAWQEIGFLAGAGSTNSTLEYSFVHDAPSPGENYYRLKQMDFDGGFEYSMVINLSVTSLEHKEVGFSPNPASKVLHLSNLETGSMTIMDTSGRILKKIATLEQEIDISDLPRGILLIQVITKNQNTIKRLIKN